MSASDPNRRLDPLAELLRRFFRRTRIRACAVEAGSADRPQAARILAGFEHHADNRSPVFIARPTDCGCARSAWTNVLRSIQDEHGKLRSAGAPLGSLPPQPVHDEPAASVSVVLAGIASSIISPAQGLVVGLVLPDHVDPAFLTELATMVRSPQLAEVRFVVLAGADAKLEAWAKKLGEERVWFDRVEPEGGEQAIRSAQALESEEQTGPGFRGAWPVGAKPPPRPRRTRTEATSREDAQSEDVEDGDAQDAAQDEAEFEHELSLLIRRAEAEMQQGRGPDALRLQTKARELCTERGRAVRAIEMEMMLGGYLLQLDQPRLAASTFARADESGFEHQAYELAAKAQLNMGLAHERDGDSVAALRAFRRTIVTGKGVADAPAVAFEAYRRAGEVALREGLDVDCIGLWGEAIAYADELEPGCRGETIKEIGKRLSELLVRHRRYSEAREIDRRVEEF